MHIAISERNSILIRCHGSLLHPKTTMLPSPPPPSSPLTPLTASPGPCRQHALVVFEGVRGRGEGGGVSSERGEGSLVDGPRGGGEVVVVERARGKDEGVILLTKFNGRSGIEVVVPDVPGQGVQDRHRRLDNAGKRTTLYKLHLGEAVTTSPTVGSNVEEVVYKNISFEVWDLGGQDLLSAFWATYYRGNHAIIVVIDSTDRARISFMKDELFRLLPHWDLERSVFLIFVNKQDVKNAMTPAEIIDAFSFHGIKNYDWHIQACCALIGDGLYDGLGWIAQRVTGQQTTT